MSNDRKETQHKGVVVRARGRAKPKIAANAGGNYGLINHHGPVVSHINIYPIFLGQNWMPPSGGGARPPPPGERPEGIKPADINYVLPTVLVNFLNDYIGGSAVSMLHQYGFSAGVCMGVHLEGAFNAPSLDDGGVAQLVANLHAEGIVPDDNPAARCPSTNVALIFCDETVPFNDPLIGAFNNFLYGYHSFDSTLRSVPIYYGVVSPMSDANVKGDDGMSSARQLDRICRITTHELSELISDPGTSVREVSNLAWYSDSHGEIGDICEGHYGSFSGPNGTWAMQLIYSLADDAAGKQPCVSSTTAQYVSNRGLPADAIQAAAARAAAETVRALLPLPATYRNEAGVAVRMQSEVFQYARRLMANLPYEQLHGHIPALLREMADALERGSAIARNGGAKG